MPKGTPHAVEEPKGGMELSGAEILKRGGNRASRQEAVVLAGIPQICSLK